MKISPDPHGVLHHIKRDYKPKYVNSGCRGKVLYSPGMPIDQRDEVEIQPIAIPLANP